MAMSAQMDSYGFPTSLTSKFAATEGLTQKHLDSHEFGPILYESHPSTPSIVGRKRHEIQLELDYMARKFPPHSDAKRPRMNDIQEEMKEKENIVPLNAEANLRAPDLVIDGNVEMDTPVSTLEIEEDKDGNANLELKDPIKSAKDLGLEEKPSKYDSLSFWKKKKKYKINSIDESTLEAEENYSNASEPMNTQAHQDPVPLPSVYLKLEGPSADIPLPAYSTTIQEEAQKIESSKETTKEPPSVNPIQDDGHDEPVNPIQDDGPKEKPIAIIKPTFTFPGFGRKNSLDQKPDMNDESENPADSEQNIEEPIDKTKSRFSFRMPSFGRKRSNAEIGEAQEKDSAMIEKVPEIQLFNQFNQQHHDVIVPIPEPSVNHSHSNNVVDDNKTKFEVINQPTLDCIDNLSTNSVPPDEIKQGEDSHLGEKKATRSSFRFPKFGKKAKIIPERDDKFDERGKEQVPTGTVKTENEVDIPKPKVETELSEAKRSFPNFTLPRFGKKREVVLNVDVTGGSGELSSPLDDDRYKTKDDVMAIAVMPEDGLHIEEPLLDTATPNIDVKVEAGAFSEQPSFEGDSQKPDKDMDFSSPDDNFNAEIADASIPLSNFSQQTVEFPSLGGENLVSDEDLELSNIDVKVEIPSFSPPSSMPGVEVELEKPHMPEVDVEIESPKSSFPSFHLPEFGSKVSVNGNLDLSIVAPKAETNDEVEKMETPSVNKTPQKIDLVIEKPEAKLSFPSFSLPSFGRNKKAEDIKREKKIDDCNPVEDIDAEIPQSNMEAKTLSLEAMPEVNVELKKPEADVKFPSFKLPNFGRKNEKQSASPNDEKNFDALPNLQENLEISMDLGVPEIDVEVDSPKSSLPLFSSPEFSSKTMAEDSDDLSVNSDLDLTLVALKTETDSDHEAEKIQMETPLVNMESQKVPSFSLPSFGGNKKTNDDEGGNLEVEKMTVGMAPPKIDLNIEKPEAKFSFPSFSLPSFGQNKRANDSPIESINAEISVADFEVETPSVIGSMPKVEVELEKPEADVKFPSFKLPNFGGETVSQDMSNQVDIDASPNLDDGLVTVVDSKVPEVDVAVEDKNGNSSRYIWDFTYRDGETNLNQNEPINDEVVIDNALPNLYSNLDASVDLNVDEPDETPSVDISPANIELEVDKPEAKFSFPSFSLPSFGGHKTAKVDDRELKIDIPSQVENICVEIPQPDKQMETPILDASNLNGNLEISIGEDINGPEKNLMQPPIHDITPPNIDLEVENPEAKFSFPSFSFPSFGVNKKAEEEKDIDNTNSVEKIGVEISETDVVEGTPSLGASIPKIDVELEMPSLDASVPGFKVELEKPQAEVHFPSFKLPTFGVKNDSPDTTSNDEVNINNVLPILNGKLETVNEIDVDEPEKNQEKTEVKVETPSVGVSFPRVEVELEKPQADIKFPSFKLPNFNRKNDTEHSSVNDKVNIDDNLPHLNGSLETSIDLDVNEPKKNQIEKPSLDMSLPHVDQDEEKTEAQFGDDILPHINGNLEISIDLAVDEPEKNQMETPPLDMSLPNIEQDVEINEGKFSLPSFSLPSFALGRKAKDDDGEKTIDDPSQVENTGAVIPESDVEMEMPSINASFPEVKVELEKPQAEVKFPSIKLPNFGGKNNKKNGSADDEVNIDYTLPHLDGNLETSIDLAVDESAKKQTETSPLDMSLPIIDEDEEKTEAKFSLPSFSLPSFAFSKKTKDEDGENTMDDPSPVENTSAVILETDVQIETPSSNASIPKVKVELEKPRAEVKFPSFKLPNFVGKNNEKNGSNDDERNIDYTLPHLDGNLESSIDLAVDEPEKNQTETPPLDMSLPNIDQDEGKTEAKFSLPSFSLPTFALGKKAKDDNGEKTIDDPSQVENTGAVIPESDVEMETPSINASFPELKVELEKPQADVEFPSFKLPNFGGKNNDTLPHLDGNLEMALDLAVDEPQKNQTETVPLDMSLPNIDQDEGKTEAKFSLPSFSLPSFALGKKANDEDGEKTIDDPSQVENTGAVIQESDVEMETPSINASFPELKVELEKPQAEVKFPSFKLPNFGGKKKSYTLPHLDGNLEMTVDLALDEPHKNQTETPPLEMSLPNINQDEEKTETKFSLPSFSLPNFSLGKKAKDEDGEKTMDDLSQNENTGAFIPEPDVEMEMPSSNASLPKVELEIPQAEVKFPSFKPPNFGGKNNKKNESADDEVNIDYTLPHLDGNLKTSIDLAVDESEKNQTETSPLDMSLPIIDEDEEKTEAKFSLPSFSLPSFALSKKAKNEDGEKTMDDPSPVENTSAVILETDVQIETPSSNASIPKVKVELEKPRAEVKFPSFKLPNFGGKNNEKNRSADVEVNIDYTLPHLDGNLDTSIDLAVDESEKNKTETPPLDMSLPNIDQDEGKTEAKFSLPSFSLPSFSLGKKAKDVDGEKTMHDPSPVENTSAVILETDVEMETPSSNTSIPNVKVELEKPQAEVKFPSFKLPNFGRKNNKIIGSADDDVNSDETLPHLDGNLETTIDLAVDKPEKNQSETPAFDMSLPNIDQDKEKTEAKLSLPSFSLPSFVLSKKSKNEDGEKTLDEPSPVENTSAVIPETDMEIETPSSNASIPKVKVELEKPQAEIKFPSFKLPNFSVKTVNGSADDEVNIDDTLPYLDGNLETIIDLTVDDSEKNQTETPSLDSFLPNIDQDEKKTGAKFSLPSFSLPSFARSKKVKDNNAENTIDDPSPAENGVIPGPDVQMETPSLDASIPTVNVEFEKPQAEGKFPSFKLPSFGGNNMTQDTSAHDEININALPNIDDNLEMSVDLAVDEPDQNEMETLPQDMSLPKIDLEVESPKANFSFPSFSLPSFRGNKKVKDAAGDKNCDEPSSIVNAEIPEPKIQEGTPSVDVSIPKVEVELEKPHAEVKFPSFNLPNFGTKNSTHDASDDDQLNIADTLPDHNRNSEIAVGVAVDVPEKIQTETLPLEKSPPIIDLEAEKPETKFSLPSFSLPSFGVSKKTKDEDERKANDYSRPVQNISTEFLEPDVQIETPSVDASIPNVKVELEKPQAEIKFPSFKLPTFGGKNNTQDTSANNEMNINDDLPNIDDNLKLSIDLAVDEPAKNEMETLPQDVSSPKIDLEVEKPEAKFSFPSFSLPSFGGNKKGKDVVGEKNHDDPSPVENIGIKIPEPDFQEETPSGELSIPKVEVELEKPHAEVKFPSFKLPNFGRKNHAQNVSGSDEVYIPDTLPHFNGDSKTTIDLTVDELEKNKMETPPLNKSPPNIDLEVEKPGAKFSLPSFRLPSFEVSKKAKDEDQDKGNDDPSPNENIVAEIPHPDVQVETPSLDASNPKVNIELEKPEADIKFPSFKLPTIGGKNTTQDPSANNDVNINHALPPVDGILETSIDLAVDETEKSEMTTPQHDMSIPKIELEVERPDAEFSFPSFSLPRFGRNKKAKDAEIKKDIDDSSQVENIGAELPESDVQEETQSLDAAIPKIKDAIGKPKVEYKFPSFKLPKFGGKKNTQGSSDNDAVSTDNDLTNSSGSLETHVDIDGEELEANFSPPTLSLPHVGGMEKANNFEMDVDDESHGKDRVEIPKPDLQVQASLPSIKLEFEKPEADVTIRSFKLPQFGAEINTQDTSEGTENNGSSLSLPNHDVDLELDTNMPGVDINLEATQQSSPLFSMPMEGDTNDIPQRADGNLDMNTSAPLFEAMDDIKAEKTEVETPSVDVFLPKVNAEVEKLNVEMQLEKSETKNRFSVFKLPKFSWKNKKAKNNNDTFDPPEKPTVGNVPDVSLSINSPDLNTLSPVFAVEENAVRKQMDKPSLSPAILREVNNDEKEPSYPKIGNEFKRPEADLDSSPNVDADFETLSTGDAIDFRAPDNVTVVEISDPPPLPDEKISMKHDLPKPEVEIEKPDINISDITKEAPSPVLPVVATESEAPKIEVDMQLQSCSTEPDVGSLETVVPEGEMEVNVKPEDKKSRGLFPLFSFPKFGRKKKMPEADVAMQGNTDISAALPTDDGGNDLTVPIIDQATIEVQDGDSSVAYSLPDIEVKMENPNLLIPSLGEPSLSTEDESTESEGLKGSAEVLLPHVDIDIATPRAPKTEYTLVDTDTNVDGSNKQDPTGGMELKLDGGEINNKQGKRSAPLDINLPELDIQTPQSPSEDKKIDIPVINHNNTIDSNFGNWIESQVGKPTHEQAAVTEHSPSHDKDTKSPFRNIFKKKKEERKDPVKIDQGLQSTIFMASLPAAEDLPPLSTKEEIHNGNDIADGEQPEAAVHSTGADEEALKENELDSESSKDHKEIHEDVEFNTDDIQPATALLAHVHPNPMIKENVDDAWKSSNGQLDTLLDDGLEPNPVNIQNKEEAVELSIQQVELLRDLPEKEIHEDVEFNIDDIQPATDLLAHAHPNPTIKENVDDAWKSSNGQLDTLLDDDLEPNPVNILKEEEAVEPSIQQVALSQDLPENEIHEDVEFNTDDIQPATAPLAHAHPNPTIKENVDDAWKSSNGQLDTLLDDDLKPNPVNIQNDEEEVEPSIQQVELSRDLPEKDPQIESQSEATDETNAQLLLQDVSIQLPSVNDSSLIMPTLPPVNHKIPGNDLTFTEDSHAKLLLEDVHINNNSDIPPLVPPETELNEQSADVRSVDLQPLFDRMKDAATLKFDDGYAAIAFDDIEGDEMSVTEPVDIPQGSQGLVLGAPSSVDIAPIGPDLLDLRQALENCKNNGILKDAESFCQSFFRKEFDHE